MCRSLQIFGLVLALLSCTQKKSESSPAPEQPPAAAPAPGTTSPTTPGTPNPGTPNPGTSPGSPAGPAMYAALKIQVQGTSVVGETVSLQAIAVYTGPDSEAPVAAQWSLVVNEAQATLEPSGLLTAQAPGLVRVQADYEGRTATQDVTFDLGELLVQEEQFWVYRQEGSRLLFNSPWDAEAGHEIRTTPEGVPQYGLDCLQQAHAQWTAARSTLDPLRVAGGTRALIFLVNVVPLEKTRDTLRRWDRDAYFWHLNRLEERPSLAFSRFREGAWVWEVIATPKTCLQPDAAEMQRYVGYALQRLKGTPHAH